MACYQHGGIQERDENIIRYVTIALLGTTAEGIDAAVWRCVSLNRPHLQRRAFFLGTTHNQFPMVHPISAQCSLDNTNQCQRYPRIGRKVPALLQRRPDSLLWGDREWYSPPD